MAINVGKHRKIHRQELLAVTGGEIGGPRAVCVWLMYEYGFCVTKLFVLDTGLKLMTVSCTYTYIMYMGMRNV